ncbi:helix-turn-helix domain-containing protein [Solirubrobacter sp. CPCC 204708]|uniref:Helix-turn-helix domain-containing protein n=1 Tax=Solirubrobacter deserti TaxID=2282478 RepID=A0ABT4RF61_9ACTN|nr:helix-turn-helix domain-containing protein [Solirubrobacter deserti]MBE2319565.1 helix-turn-helix domain-containing protein [Solirubrobacter deserti]MDA0137148.1 helix-turn-helix domain-containing protein [Solirubrobacter deserti]
MNLKALRGDVSVLELARRSGVARNTITALERGDGNPTLDTLYALADALGVPLAALLETPPASTVVRAGEGVLVEGAAIHAHLIDRFERPGVFGEVYAIRFRAGERREAPPHPFGVEERLHLHTGRVRVGPVDALLELGPGDYASYSGSVPHLYEALEDASGTLLILTGRSSR